MSAVGSCGSTTRSLFAGHKSRAICISARQCGRIARSFRARVRDRAQGGVRPRPRVGARCNLSRPSVALLPWDIGAAPLIIAFSDFPGLRVRLGRWYVVPFPTCGCDACDETAESETERLRSLVDNMTAGRFREAIRARADGTAWKESEFWSTGGRCPEELRLDQTRMRKPVDEGDRSSYEWGPWPRRN